MGLAAVLVCSGWAPAIHLRGAAPIRRSSSHLCLKPPAQLGPMLKPLEVLNAQLSALQSGEGAGVREAFAFVSPTNGKRDGGEDAAVERFQAILQGAYFEDLLGCTAFEVFNPIELSEDSFAASVRDARPGARMCQHALDPSILPVSAQQADRHPIRWLLDARADCARAAAD